MVEKILKLLQSVGKSEFSLEKEIGLAQGSIKHWRTAKSKPSTDAIIKIAKYFNVSADYLLGTEPTDEEKKQGVSNYEMTPDKEELLMLYEELSDEGKSFVLKYIRLLVDGDNK